MLKFYGVCNLASDVELKDVGNTKIGEFSVATNEYVGTGDQKKETAHFFNAEVWDTGAENLAKLAKKGDRVLIEGIIRQQRWEAKDSGEKRQKVVIRVQHFTVIPRLPKAE